MGDIRDKGTDITNKGTKIHYRLLVGNNANQGGENEIFEVLKK